MTTKTIDSEIDLDELSKTGAFQVVGLTANAHRFDDYVGKNMYVAGGLHRIVGVLDENHLAVRPPVRLK